jgi:RimJ/RimL family protein N-acetyltransferase
VNDQSLEQFDRAGLSLTPSYPVRTSRLELRPPVPGDVDALLSYQSREDVCRFVAYRPRSRERVVEVTDPANVRSVIDGPEQNLSLVLVVAGTGTLVGDVILMVRSEDPRAGEIGYVLHPWFEGRGYASEAANELLRLAFAEHEGLCLEVVEAQLDSRNVRSASLATRLGMRRHPQAERVLFKDEWIEKVRYVITRDEWQRSRGEE